ncbi:MAG: carboxypeptidase regulatory-like domain-containing protein [Planctomycetota bacterium]
MLERRQSRREVSTSGRTSVLLLLVVALALALGIVLWTARSGPRIPSPAPTAPPESAPPADPEGTFALSAGAAGDAAVPARNTDPGAVPKPGPERFEGRGVIRGEVVAQGGAAMPERWTLFLEPHPWLEGREKAEARRIEFEHGETTFRAADLPLGGYLVRAVAPGLNDLPANVLLVRGSSDQFVTLALRSGGFLDGGVIDASGRPADGLDVTLESIQTRSRRNLTTDAAGGFVFRDVQDGEYELLFGRAEAPLLPPERFTFKAPSLRFPTRTLPATGTLNLIVVDLNLRPQPRARISGSNTSGSSVDAFADHRGRATVRHVLPGRYLLDATSEEGLEGHASFELAAGQELEMQLLVRERKTPR